MTAASYQTSFDRYFHQGYRPLWMTAFTSRTGPRTNFLWENVSFSQQDFSAINTRMQNYLKTHQVPNAAIAITKDGRLVYAGGYGWAEKGNPPEAAPTSLFRISNVAKAVTAVAILKLVEANKLSLDDKVFGPASILGSRYPTPAFNKRIEQITVRHLLQHTSGFTDAPNDPLLTYPHLAPDQLIRTVINDPARALPRDPGTQFDHNSFGYIVLGRVIEQLSGTTYEQYVKANVLAPAGIKDMTIGGDSTAARKPREVTYHPADAYSRKVANTDAAAGWIASPIELARFLVQVDGSAAKPDVISAASHALMMASSGIKDANGRDPFHGLGWYVSPQALSGAMPGSLAYVAVLPGGFTVAVVTNTRPASDELGQNLRAMAHDIIASVQTWPSYDLFNGPSP